MCQSRSDQPVYVESVLEQKVKMLFSGSIFSITINATVGLILIIVQLPVIPISTSLSWYAVLLMVLISRCVLLVYWQRDEDKTGIIRVRVFDFWFWEGQKKKDQLDIKLMMDKMMLAKENQKDINTIL